MTINLLLAYLSWWCDEVLVSLSATSHHPDILISSNNLERLLYRISGDDDRRQRYDGSKITGKYTIAEDMKARLDDFAAGYATEKVLRRISEESI